MFRRPVYTDVTLTIRRRSTNNRLDVVTLDRIESKGLYTGIVVKNALVIKDFCLTYFCDSILKEFDKYFTSHKECAHFRFT